MSRYVNSDIAAKQTISDHTPSISSENEVVAPQANGVPFELKKRQKNNNPMFPATDVLIYTDPLLDSTEFKGNMQSKTIEYHARKSGFTYGWSYEEVRARNKLGVPEAIIFMIKSAFGLGVFTSCVGFAMAGYLQGTIICLFMCYLTTYGMWTVGNLANEIEQENKDENFRVQTYHDTAVACVPPFGKNFIKILVIACLILVNLSIPIANTVQVAVFIHDEFDANTLVCKGCIGLVYQTIIIQFPEPEKLKLLAMPIFFTYMIIFLSVLGNDLYLKIVNFEGFIPKEDCSFGKNTIQDLFRWQNTTAYLGIALYGYEAVGTLFPIRNTMKDPKKITTVSVSSFLVLGVLFLQIGLFTYMVYGNDTLKSAFYCYTWNHQPFFYICEVIFNLLLTPFMPFYIIAIFEPQEYFPSYKNMVSNADGTTSRVKQVTIRGMGTLIIVACCCLSNDTNMITEFAGNLFNPLVSFMIPLMMVHSKAFLIDKKRKSIIQIIHDLLIFLFSVFMMCYGTYNQIYGMINKE